jgi:glutathione synthase
MRIGIVISDRSLARAVDTSLMLAREASRRGHEVSVWGIGDLSFEGERPPRATGITIAPGFAGSNVDLLGVLQNADTPPSVVEVGDLDLLLLRSDPNEGPGLRSWNQQAIIRLGQLALDAGVYVVNSPEGLVRALDKSYLAVLPSAVTPRFLVSRDAADLRRFIRDLGGPSVLKPAAGGGGRRVFRLLDPRDRNLPSLLDLLCEEGYVMAQHYVPEAAEGTIRLFAVGGSPLVVDGRHAALLHRPGDEDHRSNVHAGGSAARADLTPADVTAADLVAPVLDGHGLPIVGLDLAGGMVLEVNVFCPGGLWGIERFEGPGFAAAVLRYLEHRQEQR